MFNRILSALTWPGRKLIGLEREGRVTSSLIVVDAAGLGLWLFVLNGFLFHRPLDQDDYSTIMIVPPLCYAACLQYGLRRGRPWWHWGLRALLGHALAAVILHYVFVHLGMDLSGRQVLKFSISYLPLLLLTRLAYLLCRRTLPGAPLECVRLTLAAGAGLFLFCRFITNGAVGTGDSYWYCIMIGDFVTQWRAGLFPVFVGQSEYAFNGAVSPLRFAPGLQHLAGLLDLFSGQSLSFHALQNLTLAVCALAGIFSAYFCAVAILPGRRWIALALAMLYLACPGVLSLGYQGDLFMSMTALPFIPLVFYGLWRTLQGDRSTSIAWTVLPVAAVWYCHAPIALWLTFAAMLAHGMIGLRRWRDPSLYAWWGWGLALFLLATSYLFVSVATLQLPKTGSDVYVILESIQSGFPGMFLPVNRDPRLLTDYQLGWTLWGLLLLSVAGSFFRPRRSEGVLLAGAAALILLLLPIPWLNSALWHALPVTVRDITYHWPMQRFYAILAGLTIVAAAGTIAKLGKVPLLGAAIAVPSLALCLAWSFSEATKFSLQDYMLREGEPAPAPIPDAGLDRNNIVLTRYAFNPFPFVPPYFSHGYIDPYLENRVLGADLHTVLASNVTAAEPSDTAAQIPLTALYDGDRVAVLSPVFGIAPGVRYAVRFVPSAPLGPGSLLVFGPSVLREYFTPDSGMGMQNHVPGNAFGFKARSRDFFPLWTMQAKPETVEIRYAYDAHPAQPVPTSFARLYLQTYTPETLPIKVYSWMPYGAKMTAAAEGSWLETPRMYLPGYAAVVNGQPAEVSPSPGGLVAVRLQAGDNDVVLRYRGPWSLRAAYWIALLTWAAVIGTVMREIVRRWLRTAVA